jgi:ferredoxin/flavodoxin---NADP+ reductase
MPTLGSTQRPLRIAIVGAGPSGFYAASALLDQAGLAVSIDMFDRLPAPYGLVRYGVAPDHPKIKSVTKIYDRTAADPRFRFFGNVDFGKDITHADLQRLYDQIIYAVGAQSDRRLGIPGEDLANSMSATEFVAWYNGHPYHTDLMIDLSGSAAAVVGVGNVAMDVARMLVRSADELRNTDISDYALEQLAKSAIVDVYILARRGPAQAKFTPAELKEFGELQNVDILVHPEELVLDTASAAAIEHDSVAQRNMELLREYAERPLNDWPRRVHFRFLVSPIELVGDASGRVAALRLERNMLIPDSRGELSAKGTGEIETLDMSLVLRSVGYRGIPLEGVPYDTRSGTISNHEGRVVDPVTGGPVPGEYVVGWAKRGPTGIIGTNKPDSAATVRCMVDDLPNLTGAREPDPAAVDALLEERRLEFITVEGWRILDQLEVAHGVPLGKPRVKFTHVQDMLAALRAAVKVKVGN